MHSVQSTGDGGSSHLGKKSKDDELVASTPSQRNYKGILIALVVICAICGLILFAIYLLRPPDDGPRVKGRKVTLGDTISKHFLVPPFNGTWVSDNDIMYRDSRGGISVLNSDTLGSKNFLSNTTFRQLNSHKYSVSPDKQYVLFTHDVKPVWEYSSLAKYTVYDIANEFKMELNSYDMKSRDAEQSRLQHAEWGPNGNAIILVYRNDIYYKTSINSTRTIRITNTGHPGVIFNGVPDWIYEVTVFKSPKALWMSPNGKFLMYASFNDSSVGEVSYHWYGDALAYPKLRQIRYPKAGTTNPEVTLWVVNLEAKDVRPVQITIPQMLDSRNHYFVNVQWVGNQEISTTWVNRQQTTAEFFICNSTDWICKSMFSLNPSGIGWLEFPQSPIFSSNGDKCVLRIPLRDGDAGYFHHVAGLDVKTGNIVPVTNGQFEITKILAWDQFNQFIYFIGIPPAKQGERHLYRVSEKPANAGPICLTCPNDEVEQKSQNNHQPFDENNMGVKFSLDNYNGTLEADFLPACLYNNAIFSPSQQYYVRECLGPEVPFVTLHKATNGKQLFVLDANSAMDEEVANLGLPQVKNFQVETSDGFVASARLYLPAGFRDGEEFKFPLVLHVAGTPGSQMVSEKWRVSWASYLTSQKNFIVAEIDGRETGYGASHLKPATDKNYGEVYALDQLQVIQYLMDNLSFVDERNLAVWGSGYGAYITLLVLAHDDNNIFKCAIPVAPITKWEFYNSVDTERLLGTPNVTEFSNIKGDFYEDGDISGVVKKLHGKKFLLIHGTADEKVQYQHTLHLTKALIKEGVSFTEQVYPDEGHEFVRVLDHLHTTMEAYLDTNFEIPDWEDWEKANFLGIKM